MAFMKTKVMLLASVPEDAASIALNGLALKMVSYYGQSSPQLPKASNKIEFRIVNVQGAYIRLRACLCCYRQSGRCAVFIRRL